MITILEGPDCSGKTTLAKMGYTDAEYIHLGPPPPQVHQPRDEYDPKSFPAWQQYTTEIWKATAGNPNMLDFLYDRLMYGELIYGPILRPSATRFNWVYCRMLERVLLGHQTVLIACQTDYDTCVNVWKEQKAVRHELVEKPAEFKRIYDAYTEVFKLSSLPVVSYDFTTDDIETTVKYADTQRTPKNYGPGIGNYTDGVVLLVGEEVNPKASVYGWPFVALAGSSYWVTELLLNSGIMEKQLYWVNAMDPQGKVTSADFLKKTDEPMPTNLVPSKIVALGTTAAIWCKKNGLDKEFEVSAIAHPAYHKRFKSSEEYQLVEVLNAN
jgi:hypothetical protein